MRCGVLYHTKYFGVNKIVLQLKTFTAVLLSGLIHKKCKNITVSPGEFCATHCLQCDYLKIKNGRLWMPLQSFLWP